MKPYVTLITLGVDDVARAVEFYRALGLHTPGIIGRELEHGTVAFFDLQPGLKLAVWARGDLAWDTGLQRAAPSITELSLAHNVRSEREVDDVMRQAKDAGARIVKRAQKTFYGGYAGYFADPDGHLWEVAFNPAMLPPD